MSILFARLTAVALSIWTEPPIVSGLPWTNRTPLLSAHRPSAAKLLSSLTIPGGGENGTSIRSLPQLHGELADVADLAREIVVAIDRRSCRAELLAEEHVFADVAPALLGQRNCKEREGASVLC